MSEPSLQEIALQVMKGDLCRGFTILSESWYAEANISGDMVDEVMIGIYGNGYDGGTHGEFGIRYTRLSGKIAAQLQVFDDSWRVLPLFQDLIGLLPSLDSGWSRDEQTVTPQQLGEKLSMMGYRDLTRREQKSLPHEPDYQAMRLKADPPRKVDTCFEHLFCKDHPYVVCFMGGATFDEGVVATRPDVAEWVNGNCKHKVLIHPNDIFFENEEDALLVSMKYS